MSTVLEIPGVENKGVYSPTDWKEAFEEMEITARSEKLNRLAQNVIQKDGTILDVEVQARQLNFNGRASVQVLVRDITERKKAEKELRQRIEFEQLISSISTRFISLQTEEIESEITGALERLIKFVGAEHSYVVLFNEDNTHIDRIIQWAREDRLLHSGTHKNRGEKIIPFLLQKLDKRGIFFAVRDEELLDEIPLERDYIENRGVQSIVLIPMVTGEGLVGCLGVESLQPGMEWTEATLMQLKIAGEIFSNALERMRTETTLRLSERFNLIGEMATGIGHEIRNPLTAVRGLIQILSEKADCHKFTELFHIMIEELDKANAIITEYLTLAKNRTIELKLLNINHVVDKLFPILIADGINSGTQVQLDLDYVPPLLLDEKEIGHLLLNLVRNANEAMDSGGVVTISTYQDKNEVILAIKDEGPGIPQHIRGKLGVPFYTTKETATGLGLAVCYSIVARHKASLDFDTGPKGSTFFIRFTVPDK